MSGPARERRGGLGVIVLLCAAATALGLGFDFTKGSAQRFWFDAPGAFALVGAAAALVVVLATYAARLILGRRSDQISAKGARDADA
jgi:hypothetical protein